ncbi:MAG: hypothetical protein BWZ10_03055 [candidate division BRC1 bacterium ADurb.BinA364]|nr:MAG: hypothetical protein BWZ10_03055 [candidate division BRC1 bacterium ADurb.BinA364]
MEEGDPGLLATRRHYAMLLERLGKEEQAVQLLYEYLLEAPGDSAAAAALNRALGHMLETDASGKAAERVAAILDELTASNPLKIDYRLYRIDFFQRTGRLEDALLECRRALKLDPGASAPALAAGEILLALNRPDEARPYLKALADSPAQDAMRKSRAAELLMQLEKSTTGADALSSPSMPPGAAR